MIQLPPLTIDRDEYQEVILTGLARKEIEKNNAERQGLHASDLLDPLLAYWKKVAPKEVTEKQVWLFTIGRVLHNLVLSFEDPLIGAKTDSGTREEMGIHFSPDAMKEDGSPCELKSNRAQHEPAPGKLQDDYHHYLEQLATYMILTNTLTGHLWILHLNLRDTSNRTWPEPRCYTVSMTETQFFDVEHQILETRDRLIRALDERDPSALPPCRAWLCSTFCPYWGAECKPVGRFPHTQKSKWTA